MSSTLTAITVYPLKSARGKAVHEAAVERWGLHGDRRWGLIEADGSRLRTVRAHSVMSIRAQHTADGGLLLSAPGRPQLRVEPPVGRPALEVDFFDVDALVPATDPAVHAWLSAVIGRPVRLVWQDDPTRRPVADRHGGRPEDVVSLADTGPLLLTSASSLRRLRDWIAADALERGEPAPGPLEMERFRPNVVVDGFPPFVEDGWTDVEIGGVRFRVTEACDRCATTTIDPESLKSGKEPIRTLARYRLRDHKTWFGVRLAPASAGRLRVGDPVTAASEEQG